MRPRTLLAAIAAGALLVPAGTAAASNGITPLSPKSGAKVHARTPTSFKFKASGAGTYWVSVCKSKKKDSDGVICTTETFGKAKRSGSGYVYKPKFFDFPGYWLSTPGTYYWQAFRIPPACSDDCKEEGAIVKFKVV